MKCEKCLHSYISQFDGKPGCSEIKCASGSKFEPIDIPVKWIYEQIQEHPGHLSSAWSRLIQMWRDDLIEADIKETRRMRVENG